MPTKGAGDGLPARACPSTLIQPARYTSAHARDTQGRTAGLHCDARYEDHPPSRPAEAARRLRRGPGAVTFRLVWKAVVPSAIHTTPGRRSAPVTAGFSLTCPAGQVAQFVQPARRNRKILEEFGKFRLVRGGTVPPLPAFRSASSARGAAYHRAARTAEARRAPMPGQNGSPRAHRPRLSGPAGGAMRGPDCPPSEGRGRRSLPGPTQPQIAAIVPGAARRTRPIRPGQPPAPRRLCPPRRRVLPYPDGAAR